jgi:hypothetical protein
MKLGERVPVFLILRVQYIEGVTIPLYIFIYMRRSGRLINMRFFRSFPTGMGVGNGNARPLFFNASPFPFPRERGKRERWQINPIIPRISVPIPLPDRKDNV